MVADCFNRHRQVSLSGLCVGQSLVTILKYTWMGSDPITVSLRYAIILGRSRTAQQQMYFNMASTAGNRTQLSPVTLVGFTHKRHCPEYHLPLDPSITLML